MPEVNHVQKYTKTLEQDSFIITKVCCEKLRLLDPTWAFCPFCGDPVVYNEVQSVVEVVAK